MNKFITLALSLVLLYLIFQHRLSGLLPFQKAPKTIENPVIDANKLQTKSGDDQPVSGTIFEKSVSKIVSNVLKTPEGQVFLSQLIRPADLTPQAVNNYSVKVDNNIIESAFKIQTLGENKIGPVTCGHLVTLVYQIYDAKNDLIEEKLISYQVGGGQFTPEFDSVVTGMYEGQLRKAEILKVKLSDTSTTSQKYKININLKKITANSFIAKNEVKTFDDEISYKLPFLCGNVISFDAKIIRGGTGETILDTKLNNKKITMKIGDLSYPLIFSYALVGKFPIGNRTILAKRKDFMVLNNSNSLIINGLPDNNEEYLILEFSNFDGSTL